MSNRNAYTSFFKEHTECLTKGRYWLNEEYGCELGEPMCLHPTLTGYVANPKRKRIIKSYDNATPGAEHAFGVSLDIRYLSSGVSKDDKIMRPDWYFPREITVMKIGICPVVNMATGYTAQVDEKALPANGGAVGFGAPGAATGVGEHYSLGKWLDETLPETPGLLYVNPMMEVL